MYVAPTGVLLFPLSNHQRCQPKLGLRGDDEQQPRKGYRTSTTGARTSLTLSLQFSTSSSVSSSLASPPLPPFRRRTAGLASPFLNIFLSPMSIEYCKGQRGRSEMAGEAERVESGTTRIQGVPCITFNFCNMPRQFCQICSCPQGIGQHFPIVSVKGDEC